MRPPRRGSSGGGSGTIWIDEENQETEDKRIVRSCPSLRTDVNYEITSRATPKYNCLAWALGISWAWVQENPRSGYYWFPGVEREWSVRAIRKMFELVGYAEEAADATLEADFQKVAFFLGDDGSPTHFAKQLLDGRWSSKIGRINDIAHNALEDLEGDDSYGRVGLILKRKRLEGESDTPYEMESMGV